MSNLSRRSLVTSAAALPALALPAVAVAAITDPVQLSQIGEARRDPIFAAIEAHSAARQAWSDAVSINLAFTSKIQD